MPSVPSKATEAIVALFVPPACREEVVGDLHERYHSPFSYCADAITTIPYVIASRIRRTSDPQILLIQAFSLYFAFVAAAWFKERPFLSVHSSLLRLGIPAAVALMGLILEDAYAAPGARTSRGLARGPLLGVGLALATEGAFRWLHPRLAIPGWILLDGCALCLVLASAVRLLLPPVAQQLRGINVPTDWVKSSSASLANPKAGLRIVQGLTMVVAAMILATLIARQTAVPQLWIFAPLLLVAFAVLIGMRFRKKR